MTRESALERIRDASAEERLEGARDLASSATGADAAAIQEALRNESVHWVRSALSVALAVASASDTSERATTVVRVRSDEPEDSSRSESLRETTGRVVHEVDRLLGFIRLHASKEIKQFETSRTATYLSRLEALLDALRRLGRAAVVEQHTDFVFRLLAEEVAGDTEDGSKVRLAGPIDLVVEGDRTLLGLVLGNGLRNALEACSEVHNGCEVVVNWGKTDRSYWFVVIDTGPGLPTEDSSLFDIGETTKPEHLGLGLAIAAAACRSMGGSELTIESKPGEGTTFRFEWPRSLDA